MTRTTVDSILLAALAGFLGAGCGPVAEPEPRTTVPALAAPASTTGAPAETGASDDGTRQRNIVRKKLPKGMTSIALEYTVVLVDDGGGQKAVDPAEHTFAVGDSFLVRIRPQDDLYVYVFNEGPQGKRVCLLPAADEKPQLVRAGTDITLPDDGSYFTFEPPAGEEKLLVVALPQATDDIRLLATSVFKGQSEALRTEEATAARQQADSALEALKKKAGAEVRTRGPVRKVVERVEGGLAPGVSVSHVEPPGDGEASSYGIAVATTGEDPTLVLDIPLKSEAAAPRAAGN